jgi:hypothetical protein
VTGSTPDDDSRITLFTVAEANALLPVVSPTLINLRDAKARLDQAQDKLGQFTPAMRSNGYGMTTLKLEQEIAELIANLATWLHEITSLGIEVKDLDQGLIDFPSLRSGRVVYLCWRLGEGEIAYWHDLHTGFAGREPI